MKKQFDGVKFYKEINIGRNQTMWKIYYPSWFMRKYLEFKYWIKNL